MLSMKIRRILAVVKAQPWKVIGISAAVGFVLGAIAAAPR